MDIDEAPHASSSRAKTVYIPEPTYADITPQTTFDNRSLPSHDQAICIDAGESLPGHAVPNLTQVRLLGLAGGVLAYEDTLH